jgi:hypothetical protein
MLTMVLQERGTPTESSHLSWWTARARTEDVRAGFSRVDFQRAERDREGVGQLLARVGDLLVELRGLETIES